VVLDFGTFSQREMRFHFSGRTEKWVTRRFDFFGSSRVDGNYFAPVRRARDSFAMRKLRFLNATSFLQPGRGKRCIHGQGATKHFMQEVLVTVLREGDLTAAGRRVSRISCGERMEAVVVLASNQDRGLSRGVANLIGPAGNSWLPTVKSNGTVNLGAWACAQAPPIEIKVAAKYASTVLRFMVVLLFEGISRLPSSRIKPLLARRVKATGRESSVSR
jgi:hypothetical protein